jgi:hypothetical protein
MPESTHPDPDHDGQADVERWLIDGHTALIRDLTAAVNLEAGLRDATLPARHTDLVADLTQALDLDAGLAAILPTTQTPTAPSPEQPTPGRPEQATTTGLEQLLRWLADQGAGYRLANRAQPWLDLLDAYIRVLTCYETTTLALDRRSALDLALARDIARASDLANDLANDLASSRARARARPLANALASASDLANDLASTRARPLANDLASASDLASRLAGASTLANVLARTLAKDLARTLANDFARNLDLARDRHIKLGRTHDRLKELRHDFTGEDLRHVDLTDVTLEGVRWDEATQWPARWQDTIRASSTPHPDGGWQIGPGGLYDPADRVQLEI